MQRLFKSAKQKLNWSGWNKYITQVKRSKKNYEFLPEIFGAMDITETELHLGRNLKAYHNVDSDYIEKDDKDLTEYIENLPIKIYSVYMNFELDLMTHRQLDMWLNTSFPRFHTIIVQNIDKFFVPHYLNRNVYVPSNIMLQLIDLATEREELFKQAADSNYKNNSLLRERKYQDIKRREDELIKFRYTISYDEPLVEKPQIDITPGSSSNPFAEVIEI